MPEEQEQQPLGVPPCSADSEAPQAKEEEQDLPGPSTETLERYLNDSLHAWFRQEFLMEYQAEAGRLLCMVCGGELPSLHLDHIKSHVLDTHPNSLVFSSEEKHCILQAWAQTHGENSMVYICFMYVSVGLRTRRSWVNSRPWHFGVFVRSPCVCLSSPQVHRLSPAVQKHAC